MSSSEKRNKVVNKQVRMSPEELAELSDKAFAFGVSLPQFLRDCGMDRVLHSQLEAQAVLELGRCRADLGRLGGLLKLWLSDDDKRVGELVPDIRKLLDEIKEHQREMKSAARVLLRLPTSEIRN